MQGFKVSDGGELQEYGWLITAAFGLDTSWHDRAACADYDVSKRVDGKSPWHVQGDQEYGDGVRGSELIKVALMICHGCEAQYDCARYAVRGEMRGGTYAMEIGDLRWLQSSAPKVGVDNIALIDQAELEAVPVQIRVKEVRDAKRAQSRASAAA